MYKIYPNIQPQYQQTSKFIYAADMCITCQDLQFDEVEDIDIPTAE